MMPHLQCSGFCEPLLPMVAPWAGRWRNFSPACCTTEGRAQTSNL